MEYRQKAWSNHQKKHKRWSQHRKEAERRTEQHEIPAGAANGGSQHRKEAERRTEQHEIPAGAANGGSIDMSGKRCFLFGAPNKNNG